MLVDTVYSIGKLHKGHHQEEGTYFKYILGDLLKEINQRVDHLEASTVPYLLKGLVNLRKHIQEDENLAAYESQFRGHLLRRLN